MKYSNDLDPLADIAGHINASKLERTFVDKCQKLFNALENIVSLYISYVQENNLLGDWLNSHRDSRGNLFINAKIIETVNSLLDNFEKHQLLSSKYFKDLIHFKPLIMSDEVLQRERYNPENITEELRMKASKIHSNLIKSYEEGFRDPKRVLEYLCRLLYMVRSNIAHFGKSPYGPDINKRQRDESVCKVIYPILISIIDNLLEKPSTKLLVYGTLRKGETNSFMVDEIRGSSKIVSIFGYVEYKHGLPFYIFSTTNKENTIEVELIENKHLPEYIEKIDRFEGEMYRRILVPYKNGDEIGMGQIYERNY